MKLKWRGVSIIGKGNNLSQMKNEADRSKTIEMSVLCKRPFLLILAESNATVPKLSLIEKHLSDKPVFLLKL